ncbi:MAG: hypothetical protein D3910_25305 [Candidatus Electrothrix sp. ATG2]|nr:hypothetical protein [Candidatus Electrothrix sp. ATG2]
MGVFPLSTGPYRSSVYGNSFYFFHAPHGQEYKKQTFTKDVSEKQLFHTERLTFFLFFHVLLSRPLFSGE